MVDTSDTDWVSLVENLLEMKQVDKCERLSGSSIWGFRCFFYEPRGKLRSDSEVARTEPAGSTYVSTG